MLYVELMEHFDRQTCLVTYCATQGQVLDRAAEASLVIVNLDIAGGAEDLCQRLRADPSSAKVPIVVVAPAGVPRYPDVNDQVIDGDLDQLLAALGRQVPSVGPAKAAVASPEGGEAFDVESHTGMWRWAEESETWPPPPPEAAGRDMAEFTREFAGYVNSLLEAYGFLGQLSPAEVELLTDRSQQVVERMDEVLNLTQTAVNDALKRGQLGIMREMSTARNVVYERMRQLRAALRDYREESPASAESADPTPAGDPPEIVDPAEPSSVAARPVESEISRAARAKEVARRQQRKEDAVKISRPRPARGGRRRRVTGTAKKTSPASSRVFLAVAGLTVVAVAAVAFLVAPSLSKAPPSSKPANLAPVMQSVVLQQHPEGVRAEAKAVDTEADPISFFFRWRVNGKMARSASGPLLGTDGYKQGDSVQAEVTATDAIARGAPMLSQPLVIGSSATQ